MNKSVQIILNIYVYKHIFIYNYLREYSIQTDQIYAMLIKKTFKFQTSKPKYLK